MEYFNFLDRIAQAVLNSGSESVNIMLNGVFLKTNGNRIFVTCLKDSNDRRYLQFTINQYIKKPDGTKQRKTVVLPPRWSRYLLDEVTQQSLFGVRINCMQKAELAKITPVAEYGFISIESELYQYVKSISEHTNKVTFSIGNEELTSAQITVLNRAFLDQSLVNYRDVVYSNKSSRFVKTLLRKNKFYNVRPETFVPVFINVDGVYNPLNNPSLAIKSTKMYKMAVEKGRFVEYNGISGYFLTHREICEAFGIQHFVRFKSSIWYDMFVGLLQPNNENFPNTTRSVFVWGEKTPAPAGFKPVYTEEKFMNVLKEKADMHDELNAYIKLNSLDSYVRSHYGVIRYIGSDILDSKDLSVAKVSSYYSELELRY